MTASRWCASSRHDGRASPRWRADADVLLPELRQCVTGQVALWCRCIAAHLYIRRRRIADCDGSLPLMPELRVRAFYRLGVRLAHRIIVQTGRQQRMFARGFSRDATVIDAVRAAWRRACRRRPFRVVELSLWIGRICAVKRPDRFLEAAAVTPEARVRARRSDDAVLSHPLDSRESGDASNVTLCGAASPAERRQASRMRVPVLHVGS